MILSIDTFSAICGLSIIHQHKTIGTIQLNIPNAHSELLLSSIDSLLTETKTKKSSLEAIAVISGPGSFTGLRIGASVAKGLCFGLDIPLVSVSTFQAWQHAVSRFANEPDKTEIGFLIDARQGDFYGSVYQNGQLSVIKAQTFEEWMTEFPSVRQWAIETEKDISSENKTFLNLTNHFGVWNLSLSAAQLAEIKMSNGQTDNLHTFEPLYVKDFIVRTPGKKGK